MPYRPLRSASVQWRKRMIAHTSATLRAAAESIHDAYLDCNLGQAKAVTRAQVEGSHAEIEVTLGFPSADYAPVLAARITERLAPALGGIRLAVQVSTHIATHAVQRALKPIAGIKNVIPVASGKGGVGKSTTAVNLALAWQAQGARVGILDADIYGPSQPTLLGLNGHKPTTSDGKKLTPLEAHGLVAMSIGFLIDTDAAMIWRGPMVTQALTQLLQDTVWGELDYLVIDMPPGTGDIALTLSQKVPVSGAVIVTTPQDIALADARRALKMFEKVDVPVLGIVENMSVHVCSQCGHREHLFGAGGGERMAAQYGVRLLGELPLDARVRADADAGAPTVAANPRGELAGTYLEVARRAAAVLSLRERDYSRKFANIRIENS